jgi:hypothetical protein
MKKTFNKSEFITVCFCLSKGFMTRGASLVGKTEITNLLIYLISAMFILNLIPRKLP